MSAPSKQSSRWGSFLQQAVAGVESRLDNILAEGEENMAQAKLPLPVTTPATPKTEGSTSRTASVGNRTNDRLQERLARAVAAKNAQKAEKADSLALSSGVPSRAGSPATAPESPRQSIDTEPAKIAEPLVVAAPQDENKRDNSVRAETPSIEVQTVGIKDAAIVDGQESSSGLLAKFDGEASPRPSAESSRSSIPGDSLDSARQRLFVSRSSIETQPRISIDSIAASKSPEEYDGQLKQLQSDFEAAGLQRQEEAHDYIERIDALQSKLQYLAKESAEVARVSIGSSPSGSAEKKLAEKDEQIALLLEEGQKLSKKELSQMTTIKKLRFKIQEDGRELTEAKKKQEKSESDAALTTDRLRRAQGSERLVGEKQKLIVQLQKDLDSLKAERDSKDSSIADLRRQIDEAAAREKEADAKAVHESLEIERKRVSELEDDLANLKIEKNLATERGQAQVKDLREQIDKKAERARMTELEMKTEQQMLESKLEVMRARAEEVSSGTTGDAQAKLLRQIETLQSQYAVASENWQGIEASLIARATNLEKERDEATRREADIRRKAREVTLKAKRNEDELEETKSQLPSFQQDLVEHKAKLDNLQQRAQDAEAALKAARSTFEQEKTSWQAEMLQRVEEERHKWQEEAGSLGHSRVEFPVASMRRGLTTEFLGLQNLQLRRASARSVNSDNPDRGTGRRPSVQPQGKSSGHGTPIRQDSTQSFKENEDMHEAPSIHTPSILTDQDDFFENVTSPASPHQTINDMVSVSTAGAGPSVQLVERMSSAVRRLESEKVASKEDLARLSAQRDEARAEIVSLMREVQAKRDQEARITELETELKRLNSRYETTLVMLGEKSELVDELQSDIDDIKAMYRELVERTVK